MTQAATVVGQGKASPLPRGAVVVMTVQYLIVMAYLVGAGGVLVTAAAKTGNWAGLLNPGLEQFGHPMEYSPPLGSATYSNPLAWIFGLSHLASFFICPLGIAGGVAGWAYLVRIDRLNRPWASICLLVGTLTCFALVVFALTPYGMALQSWLVD
ncbi:MAG TPA: hypothetical protein VK028_15130 [Micromonosporaceae bacterium]|nr:hypothetical protein [Micromonosporaceae bacterium]